MEVLNALNIILMKREYWRVKFPINWVHQSIGVFGMEKSKWMSKLMGSHIKQVRTWKQQTKDMKGDLCLFTCPQNMQAIRGYQNCLPDKVKLFVENSVGDKILVRKKHNEIIKHFSVGEGPWISAGDVTVGERQRGCRGGEKGSAHSLSFLPSKSPLSPGQKFGWSHNF